MQKKILPEAEQYTKRNKLRRIWHKIVQVMACIVVFCTTYALILPAITLEKPTVCGMEVHTHTVECYREAAQTQQTQIVCTALHHSHTEQCQDANGSLICMWDAEFLHLHNDSCRNEAGELICPMEEREAHAHDDDCYAPAEPHVHEDSCYTVTPGELTCTLEETEGHTHAEGCSESHLICTLSEEPAHIHSAECWQQDLICTEEAAEASSYEEAVSETVLTCESVEEGHVHDETACYETVTTTQTVEVAGHTHGDSCYDSTLVCGQPEEAHTHAEGCYETTAVCVLEETEGHTHGETCYARNRELTCGKDEQTEEGALELVCSEEEYIPHIHEGDCFTEHTTADGATYTVLTCTRPQVWEHYHGEECIVTAAVSADPEELTCTLEESEGHTHGETCQDETGALVCELEENAGHTHGELCYGQWELICGLAEHTHTDECYAELTEEELAQVEYVIGLIDEMPSADEIDARVAEFEEAGDDEGEEAYLTEVYQQVNSVYAEYDLLTDIQKAYVTNADKLLELEYIWSVQTLAVTTDNPTIYQINSYEDWNSEKSVMVFGGTVSEKVTWEFVYWYAVKVEKDAYGDLRVVEILQPGVDKSNYSANDTGFILLFYYTDTIPDAEVGDYVTVNFDVPDSGIYKAEGYGTVTFSAYVAINSAAPNTTWYTSTKDFVELNLFDYNGYINSNYWTENNWYPGFQWNGGAYSKIADGYRYEYSQTGIGIPNAVTDRNKVDSIDFGNSLITNLTYGDTSNYVKSVNATNVTKTSAYYDDTGPINWIYGNNSEGYTNKPIGYSTTDDSYYDVMSRTLVSGYPALADGTMLDYLFKNGTAATKMNTESIDGLFQQNEISGAYSFNSRTNHAEYTNNFFQLYDEIITPNFILYPFGNFLPLNTITTTKATQVGAFNHSGGMRDYVERTIDDLKNDTEGLGEYWRDTQNQLVTMLEEYKENWGLYPRTINGISNNWNNLSPANAIRDFFWKDTAGGGDGPTSNTDFISQAFLDRMYNIDWDVQTNFFFGMEMKMNLMMPKDGLTGYDNGNNAGNEWEAVDGTYRLKGSPDGIPDYPMVFNFTGDDDVWVYIDGVLFLDMSGIHRHVGGRINFQSGTVEYYALSEATGDVSTTAYKTFTFKELLEGAGKDTSVLNDKGTFVDYSTHEFNFYYMERGSGSSVCRLNFNFPLLRKSALSVKKENVPDADLTLLGDPDYYFNVPYKDSSKGLLITAGTTYTVQNADGTMVKDENGNDKVFTVNEFGIFSIKAGQTALFANIPENAGEYYIQELIKEKDQNQYNTIVTINGAESGYNQAIKWAQRSWVADKITYDAATDPDGEYPVGKNDSSFFDGSKWIAHSSGYVDSSSNAKFIFEAKNGVLTSNLRKLTITKRLADGTEVPADKTFKMHVVLDGEPLAAGTSYTLSDGSAGTVTTAGIIELKAGQTATIGNILSGTQFEIYEDSGSAEGYVVSYTQTGAEVADGVTFTDKVYGTVRVGADVAVTITNTANETEVIIPGTKTVKNGDLSDAAREYTFNLTQVNEDGTAVEGGTAQEQKVSVTGKGPVAFEFDLAYASSLYNTETVFPVTYYYQITESAVGLKNVTIDPAVYLATVTVTKADSGLISAELTSLTKDGQEVTGGKVTAFTNTLTGDLSLQKLVDGSEAAQTSATFDFRFTFTDDSGKPLTGSYSATLWSVNDQGELVSSAETLPLDENGAVTLSKFYHSEFATIHGLPAGTTWKIEELSADGYIVSWTVDGAEAVNTDNSVSGTVPNAEVKVVCTNTSTYVLPETGGTGTYVYTMAGMMLMLFSAAYLLYRFSKRRREAC